MQETIEAIEMMLPARDPELVQIVDRSLADAAARGGGRLACKPGCTPCCHGVFRISQLDAARLRDGLATLAQEQPERAEPLLARTRETVQSLKSEFPGNTVTGLLNEDEDDWDRFADLPEADGACPVLDPATGRCELYTSRPLTCRIFGPPVLNEGGGLGVCELCYTGATEAQILAGEMQLRHHELEAEIDTELAVQGITGETVIAWALLQPSS